MNKLICQLCNGETKSIRIRMDLTIFYIVLGVLFLLIAPPIGVILIGVGIFNLRYRSVCVNCSQYKGRSSYEIIANDDNVTLIKGYKKVSFKAAEITEVIAKKSPVDLPFLEKTVLIRLANGKKHAVKRMSIKDADKLYSELS